MSAVAFLVELQDKISPAAKASAASLASLDGELKRDQASLRTMESALKRLQATEGASAERVEALTAAIEAKKSAIGETTNQIADFTEGTEEAGESSGFFASKLDELGGPLGLAAGALAAVGAAALYVASAILKTAFATASAARSSRILNEAMTGNAETAKAMTEATFRVSSQVALSSDKVQDLAGSLAKAGLSGSTFERSLRNLSTVASVAGEDAVGPIKEIIEKSQQLGSLKLEPDQLKGTGLQISDVYEQLSKDLGKSVDTVKADLAAGKISAEAGVTALNKAMESKFGALGDKKLLDFDVQIEKAKEGFAGMFRDVNIEPFLQGLHSLLSLLDENTATGKVVKSVLVGAAQKFFDVATNVFPYVKELILQLGIAGLKFYIALKPAIKAMGELFDFGGDTGSQDSVENLGSAVSAVGTVLNAVLIPALYGVTAAGALLYAGYQAVATVFDTLGSAASAAGSALSDGFGEAVDYLSSLDFGQIASDLIDGLVQGIADGTGLVVQAISNLGSSATGALKAELGIASPSKVFAGLGGFTAEGFAAGVDQSSAMVAESVNAMVTLPSIEAPTVPANDNLPTGGSSQSVVVEAGAIVIHIEGADKDAATIGDEVEERLGLILARLADSRGAAA